MKHARPSRSSAALLISCLALFVALGGSVLAGGKGHNINGKKIKKNTLPGNRIKKNTLPGSRIKKNSLTGRQIKESKLGQVPKATNAVNAVNATNAVSAANAANATNAANAANASSVDSVRTFSVGANDNQMVSLARTANFELMGVCDPNEDFVPPGLQGAHPHETAMVLYNRAAAPALSSSDDEVDFSLATNEGIGFNFRDPEDGAMAMSTDGHFMAVPSWGNLAADNSTFFKNEPGTDSYPFPTECHFAGAALVG